MISLFIDTSMVNVSISVVKDDKILSIIQEDIRSKFKNVYFAKPEFSSDNASGIALLTRMKYLNKEV